MADRNGGRDAEQRLRAAISTWRDSLINLTGSNRLLNFKVSRTSSVEIARPAPEQVLAGLTDGVTFRLRSLKPYRQREADQEGLSAAVETVADQLGATTSELPPPAADVLDTDKDPTDLASALRNLMRRSSQEYLDRGLWILYLAFGTLTWVDEDGTRNNSPLLLVPVRLESPAPRQMPHLTAAEEESQVNPALALKLQQYDVQLPTEFDLDETSLAAFLGAVEAAVARQKGWSVTPSLQLSYFSFAKEAMYRDLLNNEAQLAEHPAIRALALGGTGKVLGEHIFEEIPDDRIDTEAPPEATPLVLDADTSQRVAIAAAVAGHSFVMDGPPGTGKSQTIANMIGALLHAGKSVLFVSEKAAALDVVRNRLADVGLDAYLFELHSQKATRKEVAATLGRALDTLPVPPTPLSKTDVRKVRERRQQLNDYAEAMNIPRQPLGMSLHQVLGRISTLRDVPAAPTTGVAPSDLTVETFSEVLDAAGELSRAWRPAREGSTFVWRGVRERGSLDSRLYQADSALQALEATTTQHRALADAWGLTRPSQAAALARLLELQAQRPPGLPDSWLTLDSLEAVTATVTELDQELATVHGRETAVQEAAGTGWRSLPAEPAPDLAPLAALQPPGITVEAFSPEQARALAGQLLDQAEMLTTRSGSLSGLASMLGLPTPQTFQDADDLLTIAAVAQAEHRPEMSWFSASGLDRAAVAAQTLREAISTCRKAEERACRYYTAAALEEPDLRGLADRFKQHHHGLKKLGSAYRADKKTVAGFTKDGVDRGDAHQHLLLAVAWQRQTEVLARAEAEHADVLGEYYVDEDTSFEPVQAALQQAQSAVSRSHGADLSQAAAQVCNTAPPNPTLVGITNDTHADLDQFLTTLAPAPLPAARPELKQGTMMAAAAWLTAHVEVLTAAATHAEAMATPVGRPLSIAQAAQLGTLRSHAVAAHASLADHAADYLEVCGDLFAGDQTDIGAVRAALEWARQTRVAMSEADQPLNPGQAKALASSLPATTLTSAVTAWDSARTKLLDAFDKTRRVTMRRELDDYADAADLLRTLRQDSAGQRDWFAYQSARKTLRHHGLDAAVQFCIQERIPAEVVPQVIERVLLQEWADYHLASKPTFGTTRAADRDALVAEYRRLDKALIAAATGDIIRGCNERRPRTDLGAAAVIRNEASKKRKHMPVRVLIERTHAVAQAIKPCFMMSPLSVSQYLPPDIRFDVVIFDEASQVAPADAINCIYRGHALITAGDQKQLPPTSFFAATAADDGEEWSEETETANDFESILDSAKACGEFKSLTLRWHYRSRHEALIAFSNASFYDGRLVTFPSVDSDGPHVGVELFTVNGVYRRGSSRDNPIEAAKVAERVIHHFDTRPDRSLGVVAFSEAQAATIETAVDNARLDRPDLDRFFTDDRLHGFFVKNLESVQGDERDVMIFSIGYGPDENHKITMNFGPLNRPGGWRRLNVAVTRARYRNEIIASITAADITAGAASEGVRHLRRYLDYAERGLPALALDVISSGGDAESPFEESVIQAIRSWGYQLTPQVGASGYRIDIGVQHPDHPGVFVLGVECDGFQYHSSKAARDRDRLREQVLRGLGWRLHRIWGTAWYHNRHGEEERLRAAIETAVHAPVTGLLTGPDPDHIDRPTVQTEDAVFDEHPSWAVPYRIAAVPPLSPYTDPGDPGSRFDMIPGITSVVTAEGPVHLSVLHQRLRDAWDIGRIGARIRENIDAAIRHADVIRTGDFLDLPGRAVEAVRTPTGDCARSVEQVHDDELALALVNLARDTGGISADDLTTHVPRLFGWNRRGPDIRARLDALLTGLVADGKLLGDLHLLTKGGR